MTVLLWQQQRLVLPECASGSGPNAKVVSMLMASLSN